MAFLSAAISKEGRRKKGHRMDFLAGSGSPNFRKTALKAEPLPMSFCFCRICLLLL